MENKIRVSMTAEYLYDFILYHTYSKFSGVLTNILGLAVGFMGLILLITGKIDFLHFIFYPFAAVIFLGYTPVLIKSRAKKQQQNIPRYNTENTYLFQEKGITVTYGETTEEYAWEQIEKVVVTPKTIGFYYAPDQALIIPKPDFKDKFVPIMTLATQMLGPERVKLR